MKPIEAGCLATVINSNAGNNGISLAVIRYVGVVYGENGKNQWEVDRVLKGTRSANNFIDESKLMRIDGYESQDQISDGKELINVD